MILSLSFPLSLSLSPPFSVSPSLFFLSLPLFLFSSFPISLSLPLSLSPFLSFSPFSFSFPVSPCFWSVQVHITPFPWALHHSPPQYHLQSLSYLGAPGKDPGLRPPWLQHPTCLSLGFPQSRALPGGSLLERRHREQGWSKEQKSTGQWVNKSATKVDFWEKILPG